MRDTFKDLTRRVHDFDKLGHHNQLVRDDLLDQIIDVKAEFDQKMKRASESIHRHAKLQDKYEQLKDKFMEAQRTICTHEKTIVHLTQVIRDQQDELAEQGRIELHDSW